MAYSIKYLFKFESAAGTTREIRVLKDGYSGAVIQRPLGRAPMLKKQQNGPVHGTSLEFFAECNVDREFIEFYTSDPKAYRVDLYAGATLLWQGYITPELYSEPDIAPPYDVQVVATDGVGELKLYDYAAQGTVTLRTLLSGLLSRTGLGTDIYLISSLKPGSAGAGSLLEKTINLDYMAGKTCYNVLTYVLDTLHATITWWKGAWILTRETNVTFTNGKVRYFNTAGNSALLNDSVQVLGKMYTNPAWPVGQLSTVIDPAKNKIEVQAPWHPVTCLQNPDMTSDASWTKINSASYDSTNGGYLLPFPQGGTGQIRQQISMAGLRVPMSISVRATASTSTISGQVVAPQLGVLLIYTVGNASYHLRKGSDGTPVWESGALPSGAIPAGTQVDFQQTLSIWDASRIEAEELKVENIPAFMQGGAFPAGTMTVYIIGYCATVFSAHLDVVLPKGYADILRLNNGARGEGDTVEIAIGRETADNAYYAAFLQGLLLDSGSLITSFSDANFTTGMDYLAFIARDYALSVALPRAKVTGTVFLEGSVQIPPLVFTKGGLDYWVETWGWNLYDDELEISAVTLPSASLTVQSETILESNGSTVSSSSGSGSSSAGSSMGGGGGTNYWEIDGTLNTLLKPKDAYAFVHSKDGLFFTGATLSGTVVPDLYVDTVNNQRVLRSPLPLITGGDQIVISGTPGGGGGGGGATSLYQLDDVYHSGTNVLRADGTARQAGDALVFNSTRGWVAAPVGGGTITSVSLAAGATNGTLHLVVNGTAQSDVAVTGLGSMAYKSSLAFSELSSHPTNLSGYGITDAKFGTAGSDYIPITLGSTTKNVLTAHQSLSAYLTSATAASTYQPLDADLTAIAGLSGTSGFLKKTAANTWSLDTNTYLTGITSTMVTNALGYTPVNPSSLGTIAWYNETSFFRARGRILPDTDISTYDGTIGSYFLDALAYPTITNAPARQSGFHIFPTSTNYGDLQIASHTDNIWYRVKWGDSWYSWHKFWHDGNANGTDKGQWAATSLLLAGAISGATSLELNRTLANSDFNAITIINRGSWSQAYNTIAGVNVTDGTGTVGKFGIGFDGVGYFAVKGLHNSGYGVSGEVFKVNALGLAEVTSLKIGSATITWNSNGYLHIDQPLVTAGDQIVISGTPGGGGGGGATTLWGLDDVNVPHDSTYPGNGDLLSYDLSTHKWVNVAASSVGGVTSVVGQTGAVTAAQISSAIGLSNYVTHSWLYTISPTLDNLISQNLYFGGTVTSGKPSGVDNDCGVLSLRTYNYTDGGAYGYHQILFGDSHIYVRRRNASTGTFGSWNTVYDSGNFIAGTNYQAPLSPGTGISISNNTISVTANTYQPLDSDLTAIASISSGTGLLKRSVSGSTVTWSIDTNTYLTGNQTITLSGDVSGSGATSITTTIGDGKVTNAMLAGSIENSKLNTVGVAKGGTGLTTWTGAYRLVYSTAATTLTTLAPNSTSTRKFLRQVGANNAATAPAWDTVTKTDVGLSNVENTALSTWAGTTNITTLGTITSGTWNGSAIAWSKLSISAQNLYDTIGSTKYAPYNANGYLPLSAGSSYTLSGDLYFSQGSNSARIVASSGIFLYGGGKRLGISSSGVPEFWPDATTSQTKYTIYHTGNLSLATLAGSSAVGSGSQPVYYTGSTFAACSYSFGNASGNVPISNGTLNTNLNAQYLGGVTEGSLFRDRGLVPSGTNVATYTGPIGGMFLNAHADSTITNAPYSQCGFYSFLPSQNYGALQIAARPDEIAYRVKWSSWYSWHALWHNGNSGTSTTSWACSNLTASGTITSTGDQVVSSDLTLKTNLTPVTYSVADIAKARAVEFDWRDGRGHSMGSIAQDWLGIAPALVHGEEGNMSLAYGQLALVNTILLARQSESHEERIARLEARVAELEMENERLRMN